MRKTKFLIAGIIAFFMFSCIDDLDLPPSSEMQQTTTFGISDAMRYFEENADDLSFIHFKDSTLTTRSATGKQTELTPDWDNAVHSANRVAELVEIPVLSNAVMFSNIRRYEKGKNTVSRVCQNNVRLIIARRKDGSTEMFLVTLIPSEKYGNSPKKMANFRYLGGSDFTGKVFASTLDGRFVEASQYVNGKFVGQLKITTRQQLAENDIDITDDPFYESIVFGSALKTRSGTYNVGETGGGGGSIGGGGGSTGGGSTGGGDIGGGGTSGGYCPYHPQFAASNCPYCLDEVIVISCRLCGARLEEGEICNCRCSFCGQYPCRCCTYCNRFPCICMSTCSICRPYPCTKCTKCNRHYCFGTCDSKPDPDIPGSGSDKPDKPDQNLCPKCGLPLVNCKCTEVCSKCGEPIKECKCPKKVDCSEQAIHNGDQSGYNWNKFMDAGLAANFLNKYRNAGVEYSVSLDNENGKYTMTEPYTENKLDNVPLRFGKNTEAAVHNHPRSNPPSISDVLTLAKMNERSNGKFESSFIVPKTGPIYVLQVTDKNKAANFYKLYENKISELETKRTEYLAWLISNGGGTFPEKEFDGYSLAAILQEIDCGISLLQVEGDSRSFKQMEAAVERESGEVSNIVYTICK